MAAQRGTSPSAVIGIECPECAYYIDDALVYRDWYAQSRQMTEAESQREMTGHADKARRLAEQARLGRG